MENQITENQSIENNQTASKRISRKKAIIIISVAVVICGSIVAYFLLRPKNSEVPSLITITDAEPANVEENYFETYMNNPWNFENGTSGSYNAIMGNSPNNRYAFEFELFLSDTNELLYTSPILSVGTMLPSESIVLNSALAQGEYSAVIRIHMLSDEGERLPTNTAFNIRLIVDE